MFDTVITVFHRRLFTFFQSMNGTGIKRNIDFR